MNDPTPFVADALKALEPYRQANPKVVVPFDALAAYLAAVYIVCETTELKRPDIRIEGGMSLTPSMRLIFAKGGGGDFEVSTHKAIALEDNMKRATDAAHQIVSMTVPLHAATPFTQTETVTRFMATPPKLTVPTVGRIVHYIGSDGIHRAAIVVETWARRFENLVNPSDPIGHARQKLCVDLNVFNRIDELVTGDPTSLLNIHYDSRCRVGTWHYPEPSTETVTDPTGQP